ncbi:MAG: dihydroorotase, partial [Bacteroidetes bacterium]
MRILIHQAQIAGYPAGPTDLLVHDGVIAHIGALPEATADVVINQPGLHVSGGFIDVFSHFNDPGLEYKETLETGAAAAATGGYTRVMVLPNTQPALHSKAQIEYVVQKNQLLPAQVLPIGAISKSCDGKELAEMYDMRSSGAVAFSDGIRPVQNGQLLLKALQYVKAFDGVVIQQPIDDGLSKHGLIHEGIISTQMGLPGKPEMAELLSIGRDIELLRYTGSRLHITGVSTAAGLQLIRQAKAEGLQISCSVAPYHLHFTVNDVQAYDTNLKVNPPLRSPQDVEALKAGLLDGTIDCVASHHQPHEYDAKVCEFEYAHYGMAGLETCYGAVLTAVPKLDGDAIAKIFSANVARIFNLSAPIIAVGRPAELTLHCPHQT